MTTCGAQVPSFRQVYLDDFRSRDDLLDAALASSHIPFLLDWQPTARAAGKRFIGGCLVWSCQNMACKLLRASAESAGPTTA
jgi:hypothetical protein